MTGSSRLGGLLDQRDDDWRDTLFYWHGKLSWVGGERNVMSWRGTWLSSVANVQPSAAEFSQSFNFFELNFDVDDRGRFFAQGRWDLELFRGMAGGFRGHYLMEPPDGTGYRRAYRDEAHSFVFGGVDTGPQGPFVLCAARGFNEFGRFVSLGHARRLDDALELTLARRYVRDDDSRSAWPIDQLLLTVQPPFNTSAFAPWEHSLPCRLPCDIIAESNHNIFEPPKPTPRNEYEAMMARKRPRS